MGLVCKPSMQAFESGLSVQMYMHRHNRGEENIMYSGGILEAQISCSNIGSRVVKLFVSPLSTSFYIAQNVCKDPCIL